MNVELLKKAHERVPSVPVLVNLISMREKQLIDGQKPLVRPLNSDEDKVDTALREVAEGKLISPHGEERAKINQAFNKWLEKAKEIGLFNQEYLLPGRSEDMNLSLEMSDVAEEDIRAYDPTVEYVQVSLFDLPELAECSNEPEEDIDI